MRLVQRHLEHARSFEVTFWRSFFTVASLLVILPFFQGRAVFGKIRHGGWALWLSGACWAVMFTAFMVALTMTSVANGLIGNPSATGRKPGRFVVTRARARVVASLCASSRGASRPERCTTVSPARAAAKKARG